MARIVINATHLRHRINRRFRVAQPALDSHRDSSESGVDPERQYAASELLEQVDSFLGEARIGDHELFVARFVHGTTIKEISRRTGLSIAVIKTRIHRARRQMEVRFSPVERQFSAI